MTMKSLTPLQIVGIILIINGALTGSVNELTDLLGAVWSKHVVSICIIGSGICGGFVTMFGGQATQLKNIAADPQSQEALVKAVLGMRGVEGLAVNQRASPALAVMAMDPAQDKIAPTQNAMESVARTAATAAAAPNAG